VQGDLSTGRGEREGTLSSGNGLVMGATAGEMVGQKERNLCQSTRIVEGRREAFGLAQSH
jgi:hypothetical protein